MFSSFNSDSIGKHELLKDDNFAGRVELLSCWEKKVVHFLIDRLFNVWMETVPPVPNKLVKQLSLLFTSDLPTVGAEFL